MNRVMAMVATLVLAACGAVTPTPSQTSTPSPTPESATPSPPAATPSPAAISSPSSTSRPAPESFDPATLSGRIVFAHDGDIWAMNADGSQREQLTTDPEMDFDPAWSPDGTQIAFRSHRDSDSELDVEVYLMSADGSNQRNLTNSPRSDYSPAWSPDGTQIAFASDRGPSSGGNDIYVVDIDSGDATRLTTGGGIDEYPAWSPDGSRIAYACSHGILPEGTADFEVCVMDADGANQQQLTDADGLSDYPAWSPDGTQIAFQSTRGGWPTLPDYTPPGYEPGEFGEYDIYVMGADGSDVRNVTANGRESEQFQGWSPNSEYVVFSRYGCLVAMTIDGSVEATLTLGALCADGFPDWRF